MPQKPNNPADELQQQTGQLKSNMTELNNSLVELAKNQETLGENTKESAKGFKEIGSAADDAAQAVKTLSAQLNDNAKAISVSKKSFDDTKKALTDLQQAYDSLSQSHTASSKQLNTLSNDIQVLTQNLGDQQKALTQSKQTFDYHKASVDAVKSAFDKLKSSNKDFGPVLEDATKGFNFMKTGLDAVKTGFTGVGSAIKTTGFGLLVLVLQSVVEYFTKTTEGAKKLKGGIAAISLVISNIKTFISNVLSDIGGNIVNAFTHPANTIKKVWNAVIDNLTNRFKGISVFFKGLFSGDLKEMGDGIIQMGTGVTNGTDKINNAFKTIKKDIGQAATDIAAAYKKAADSSDTAAKKIQENGKKIGHSLNKNKSSSDNGDKQPKVERDPLELSQGKSAGVNIDNSKSKGKASTIPDDAEKKQAEDFAKQSGEAVLKVDQDYKEKQKQLDKAKLDAQFANQQQYLQSVDQLSNALTGIFGKNTIAARVAFKAHQAASIGETVINTQKAIMGIWSADAGIPFIGVPKAIAETAVAAAAGATSIATMIKQKPGFAKGGHYISDGRGAVLSGYSRTDDTNAYLRSGEAVVVSEAMRNPWARNLVSAINVAHGGRDFSTANAGRGYAIGGIFTDGGNANRYYSQPANDVKDLANTLAYQMINNFPPIYVDVKDVNNQQNILAQTVNRVNL